MDREQAIEKLGDVMYAGLKANLIPISNKAYITDILSQAVYDAGYRLPEQKDGLKVLVDGEWHEALDKLKATVESIEKGLAPLP